MTVPKKLKHRITIWSSNSISEYIPKIIERGDSNIYLYTHVHSSTTSRKWEQSKCPSIDVWISSMVYTYRTEYHLALEGREFWYMI